MRRCTGCGQELPPEAFGRDRREPDGLTTRCRACRRAYLRASYVKHRERIRAYQRAYYAARREKVRAVNAAYYATHREEIRARKHAYRQA